MKQKLVQHQVQKLACMLGLRCIKQGTFPKEKHYLYDRMVPTMRNAEKLCWIKRKVQVCHLGLTLG